MAKVESLTQDPPVETQEFGEDENGCPTSSDGRPCDGYFAIGFMGMSL